MGSAARWLSDLVVVLPGRFRRNAKRAGCWYAHADLHTESTELRSGVVGIQAMLADRFASELAIRTHDHAGRAAVLVRIHETVNDGSRKVRALDEVPQVSASAADSQDPAGRHLYLPRDLPFGPDALYAENDAVLIV